jgi:hypothetical protein
VKAYEIPVEVTAEGELDIPSAFIEKLPRGQVVRLIILIREPDDAGDEDAAWAKLTIEQFQAGYSEADAIYDRDIVN